MNSQILDKLRRLYREVEKSIPDSVGYIADENLPISPDTLRNVMLGRDVEVFLEVYNLIDAILEDIADPNRSDSFTDFGEQVENIVLGIVSEDPALSDSEIAERLAEREEFYSLSAERSKEDALDIIYSKEMQEKIQDHKKDLVDSELMRKDPHSYYGVSKKNIVGV